MDHHSIFYPVWRGRDALQPFRSKQRPDVDGHAEKVERNTVSATHSSQGDIHALLLFGGGWVNRKESILIFFDAGPALNDG